MCFSQDLQGFTGLVQFGFEACVLFGQALGFLVGGGFGCGAGALRGQGLQGVGVTGGPPVLDVGVVEAFLA